MAGVGWELQGLLAAIALLSGIGITAIGPGGIFITIALYTLTTLGPAEVAGTASATFIATGILGSAIYVRSGELRGRSGALVAALLGIGSIVGALAGAEVNTRISDTLFGALLGMVVAAVGGVIVYRELRGAAPAATRGASTARGRATLAGLGLAIGFCGALLGVGGPVLAVPALVVLGTPIVLAIAVAQIQSIFIAAFATAGYAAHGAVLWPLALLITVPELVGAVIGWRVAHRVEPRRLKLVLGAILFALGPYLAF